MLVAVLGRFLHSLNQFCREAYGMDFDVHDYHVYDFAKVSHIGVTAFSKAATTDALGACHVGHC